MAVPPAAPITPPEPTKELIQAARLGDVHAWNRLDRRYRIALSLFLRGRIPNGARRRFDTEDVLQSTFMTAFRELDSYEYRGQGSFLSWMVQILRRRLNTRLRTVKTEKRDIGRDQPLTPGSEGLSASPSELLFSAENQALLMQAVADLPDRHREVVTLHFFDKKTRAQIARDLDISVRTVRRLVSEAIELLLSLIKRME